MKFGLIFILAGFVLGAALDMVQKRDPPRDTIMVGANGQSEVRWADGGIARVLDANGIHRSISIRNDAPPIAYIPARKPGEKWLLIVYSSSARLPPMSPRKGSSDLDKLRAQVREQGRKPWPEAMKENAEAKHCLVCGYSTVAVTGRAAWCPMCRASWSPPKESL